MQALAQAMWIGRKPATLSRVFCRPATSFSRTLGDAPLPIRHGALVGVPLERVREFGKRRGGHPRHREVAGKAADRITREQRIDPEMDDLCTRPSYPQARC